MRIIDAERMKNVCKVGMGAICCRYITSGREGFLCAKHDIDLRRIIDSRVAEGSYIAQGDNCPGLIDSEPPPRWRQPA